MRKNIVFLRLFCVVCFLFSPHSTSASAEAIFYASLRFPPLYFLQRFRSVQCRHTVVCHITIHHKLIYKKKTKRAKKMARRRKQQKRTLKSSTVKENSNIIWGIKGEGERYFQRNWLPPFVGFSMLMSSENCDLQCGQFCLWHLLPSKCIVRLLTCETRMKISTQKCANDMHVDTEWTQ